MLRAPSVTMIRAVVVPAALLALTALLMVLVAPTTPVGAQAATANHRARLGSHVRRHREPHGPIGTAVAHAAIIGGTLAKDNTFPQLAFILYNHGSSGFTCTGTVVAPNVVLMAGHCAEDTVASGYSVVTGNVEWSASPRQVSGVSRVVVYPAFNRTYLSGDAALLVLATPTTAPAITLASYPSDSAHLKAGTKALIVGWGDTHAGQLKPSKRLSWAGTVVQRTSYCQSQLGSFYEPSEICTIDPPNYATGACSGDSGGPLVTPVPSGSVSIELGVTSHIYGDCSTQHPSVFTRADLIAPWVNKWIAAVKPTSRRSRTLAQETPPPNMPGYYVTRPSHARKIVIHVSGDGNHIVGLRIKMPVRCQGGHVSILEISLLSYAKNLPIANHIARDTLEAVADNEFRTGHVGVYALFNALGSLEGRLRIHIPSTSRRVGLCSGTLKFTAKT